MNIPQEVVVLPFPQRIEELEQAAAAFAAQYQVVVWLEVRGHVSLSGNQCCLLAAWFHIQVFDHDLGIVGLGDTEDEDALLWVRLTGPGEVRLSPALPVGEPAGDDFSGTGW